MKREFTNSELSCYQQCPKKWWFQYHEKLQPKATRQALELGDLYHQSMAQYYGPAKRDMKPVIADFLEKISVIRKAVVENEFYEERLLELAESEEMGRSMLEQYAKFASVKDDFEVIEIETAHVAPVITNLGKSSSKFMYRFKLDMLISRKGKLWIKEFKTAKDINADYLINLTLDDQISRYCLGVNNFIEKGKINNGNDVQGVLYSVIKKATPHVPAQLKKGGLSQDKRICSTYDLYLGEINRLGLSVADYVEILEILKSKDNSFVMREEVFRTKKDLKEAEEHLYTLCKQIATNPPIWKSPTRDCGWKCSYRPLCLGDFPSLRQTDYVIREAYHPEYAEQKKEVVDGK